MSNLDPVNTSVASYSGSAPSSATSAGYLYSRGNEMMRAAAYFREAIDGLYHRASEWWYKEAREAERVKKITTDVEKRQAAVSFRDDLTAGLGEWDDEKVLTVIQTRLDSLAGNEKEDEKRWVLALLRENGFKTILGHFEEVARQPQPQSSQKKTAAAYRKAILQKVDDLKIRQDKELERKLVEQIEWFLATLEESERSLERKSITQSLFARLSSSLAQSLIEQFDPSQKRALQQQPAYSVQMSAEQQVFSGNSSVSTFTTCIHDGLGVAVGITPTNTTRVEFFNLTSDVFTRIASAFAAALEQQLNPTDGSYEAACNRGIFHILRNNQYPYPVGSTLFYSRIEGYNLTYSFSRPTNPGKVHQPAALSDCQIGIPLFFAQGSCYTQSDTPQCSLGGTFQVIPTGDKGTTSILSSNGLMHILLTGPYANKTALYSLVNSTFLGYALSDPVYQERVPNTPVNGPLATILSQGPNNSTSVSTYDLTKIQVISRQPLSLGPAGFTGEVSIANCGTSNPDMSVWVRVAQLGLEFDFVLASTNSSSVIGGPLSYQASLALSPRVRASCSNVTAMISYIQAGGKASFITAKLVPSGSPAPSPTPTPIPTSTPPSTQMTTFSPTPSPASATPIASSAQASPFAGSSSSTPVPSTFASASFSPSMILNPSSIVNGTTPVIPNVSDDGNLKWIIIGCVGGGVVLGVGGTLYYIRHRNRKHPRRNPLVKRPQGGSITVHPRRQPDNPYFQTVEGAVQPVSKPKIPGETELVEVKTHAPGTGEEARIDEQVARDQHVAYNH